jgi:hypothetical protein
MQTDEPHLDREPHLDQEPHLDREPMTSSEANRKSGDAACDWWNYRHRGLLRIILLQSRRANPRRPPRPPMELPWPWWGIR